MIFVYLYRPIWTYLDRLKPVCTYIDSFGSIWTHLDLLRPKCPIWTHLVPFGNNWTNLDQVGPIFTYMEPFGQIRTNLVPFGAIWSLRAMVKFVYANSPNILLMWVLWRLMIYSSNYSQVYHYQTLFRLTLVKRKGPGKDLIYKV